MNDIFHNMVKIGVTFPKSNVKNDTLVRKHKI